MNNSYRVLHVDDSPEDAKLVVLALRNSPYAAPMARVDTESDYVAQLDAGPPDVILCDYQMPRFSTERALEILAERQLDVPLILVSHHIGESAAVIAMQQGASDYLTKGDLGRLPKAIGAALERRDAGREKQRALDALRKSESMRRGILDSLLSRVALLDGAGMVLAVNRAWEDFDTARTSMAIATPRPGTNYLDVLRKMPGQGNGFARDLARGIEAVSTRQKTEFSMESMIEVGSAPRWYWTRVKPLTGSDCSVVVSHLDVTDRVVAHLALRDAHMRMQALSSRILAVQEEERRAISLELHDDVGQTLGALKIGLHRLSRGPAEGMPALVAECLEAADSALNRLRHLAHELRPPQLEQLGLDDALRWLAERQHAVTGIEVRFKSGGFGGQRPPAGLESACYRIAQEALNNAARHSQATLIRMNLESDGRLLKLSVHDNGIGFDEASTRERILTGGSLGLISMEERAQLAGGRVKIRTVAGSGTTVTAILPLPQHARPPASRAAPAEA